MDNKVTYPNNLPRVVVSVTSALERHVVVFEPIEATHEPVTVVNTSLGRVVTASENEVIVPVDVTIVNWVDAGVLAQDMLLVQGL
jgi:hypothetical protein